MTAVGGARICNAMPELEPRQELVGADRLLLPAKVAKAPMLLEVVAEKLSAYPSIKQGRGLIVQRNSGCLIARTVFLTRSVLARDIVMETAADATITARCFGAGCAAPGESRSPVW